MAAKRQPFSPLREIPYLTDDADDIPKTILRAVWYIRSKQVASSESGNAPYVSPLESFLTGKGSSTTIQQLLANFEALHEEEWRKRAKREYTTEEKWAIDTVNKMDSAEFEKSLVQAAKNLWNGSKDLTFMIKLSKQLSGIWKRAIIDQAISAYKFKDRAITTNLLTAVRDYVRDAYERHEGLDPKFNKNIMIDILKNDEMLNVIKEQAVIERRRINMATGGNRDKLQADGNILSIIEALVGKKDWTETQLSELSVELNAALKKFREFEPIKTPPKNFNFSYVYKREPDPNALKELEEQRKRIEELKDDTAKNENEYKAQIAQRDELIKQLEVKNNESVSAEEYRRIFDKGRKIENEYKAQIAQKDELIKQLEVANNNSVSVEEYDKMIDEGRRIEDLLNETYTELQNSIKERNKLRSELETEYEEYKIQLEARMNRASEELEQNYQTALDKNEERYTREYSDMQATINDLEAKNSANVESLAKKERELKGTLKDVKDRDDELEQLLSETKKLELKLGSAAEENAQLKVRLEEGRRGWDQSKEEIREYQKEAEEGQRLTEDFKKRLSEAEKVANDYKLNLEKLQREFKEGVEREVTKALADKPSTGLQDENRKLEKIIENLTETNGLQIKQIEVIEKSIIKLLTENNPAVILTELLTLRKSTLKKLEAVENYAGDLIQTNTGLSDDFQKKLDAADATVANQKRQIEGLREEDQRKDEELSKKTRTLEELKEQLSLLDEQLKEEQEKRTKLGAENGLLKAGLKQTEKESREVKVNIPSKATDVERDLKEKITELEEQVRLSQSDYTKAKEAIEDLEKRINEKESEAGVIERELKEARENKTNIGKLDKQAKDAERERVERVEEVKRVRDELVRSRAQNEKNQADFQTKLRSEKEAHEENISRLEKQIVDLKARATTLSARPAAPAAPVVDPALLTANTEKIRNQAEQLKNQQAAIEKSKARSRDLERQIGDLKAQIKDLERGKSKAAAPEAEQVTPAREPVITRQVDPSTSEPSRPPTPDADEEVSEDETPTEEQLVPVTATSTRREDEISLASTPNLAKLIVNLTNISTLLNSQYFTFALHRFYEKFRDKSAGRLALTNGEEDVDGNATEEIVDSPSRRSATGIIGGLVASALGTLCVTAITFSESRDLISPEAASDVVATILKDAGEMMYSARDQVVEFSDSEWATVAMEAAVAILVGLLALRGISGVLSELKGGRLSQLPEMALRTGKMLEKPAKVMTLAAIGAGTFMGNSGIFQETTNGLMADLGSFVGASNVTVLEAQLAAAYETHQRLVLTPLNKQNEDLVNRYSRLQIELDDVTGEIAIKTEETKSAKQNILDYDVSGQRKATKKNIENYQKELEQLQGEREGIIEKNQELVEATRDTLKKERDALDSLTVELEKNIGEKEPVIIEEARAKYSLTSEEKAIFDGIKPSYEQQEIRFLKTTEVGVGDSQKLGSTVDKHLTFVERRIKDLLKGLDEMSKAGDPDYMKIHGNSLDGVLEVLELFVADDPGKVSDPVLKGYLNSNKKSDKTKRDALKYIVKNFDSLNTFSGAVRENIERAKAWWGFTDTKLGITVIKQMNRANKLCSSDAFIELETEIRLSDDIFAANKYRTQSGWYTEKLALGDEELIKAGVAENVPTELKLPALEDVVAQLSENTREVNRVNGRIITERETDRNLKNREDEVSRMEGELNSLKDSKKNLDELYKGFTDLFNSDEYRDTLVQKAQEEISRTEAMIAREKGEKGWSAMFSIMSTGLVQCSYIVTTLALMARTVRSGGDFKAVLKDYLRWSARTFAKTGASVAVAAVRFNEDSGTPVVPISADIIRQILFIVMAADFVRGLGPREALKTAKRLLGSMGISADTKKSQRLIEGVAREIVGDLEAPTAPLPQLTEEEEESEESDIELDAEQGREQGPSQSPVLALDQRQGQDQDELSSEELSSDDELGSETTTVTRTGSMSGMLESFYGSDSESDTEEGRGSSQLPVTIAPGVASASGTGSGTRSASPAAPNPLPALSPSVPPAVTMASYTPFSVIGRSVAGLSAPPSPSPSTPPGLTLTPTLTPVRGEPEADRLERERLSREIREGLERELAIVLEERIRYEAWATTQSAALEAEIVFLREQVRAREEAARRAGGGIAELTELRAALAVLEPKALQFDRASTKPISQSELVARAVLVQS